MTTKRTHEEIAKDCARRIYYDEVAKEMSAEPEWLRYVATEILAALREAADGRAEKAAVEVERERAGRLEKALRATWPHLEVPVSVRRAAFFGKKTHDPGAPTCLRCKLEQIIATSVSVDLCHHPVGEGECGKPIPCTKHTLRPAAPDPQECPDCGGSFAPGSVHGCARGPLVAPDPTPSKPLFEAGVSLHSAGKRLQVALGHIADGTDPTPSEEVMPDAGRPNNSSIPYLQVMTGGGASGDHTPTEGAMTVCSVCKRTFEQHVGPENDHPNLCHSWTPATRTHEEIAQEAAEYLEASDVLRERAKRRILAAIREAADGRCSCRLEGEPEREALRKLYLFGDEEIYEGVYVEWRGRRYGKGPVLWAVAWRCYCLNKSGEWEYEPQPSSRDDAFIARCRWTNLDEAIAAARSRAEDLRGSRG